MTLRLYDTLKREKADFTPRDPSRVTLYVCGPTVYDYAHIGNARPPVVFDVLNRLLRRTYGETAVVYARNVTDVDDKINAKAAKEGVPIGEVTARYEAAYLDDMARLNVRAPDIAPGSLAQDEVLQALGTGLYVANLHYLNWSDPVSARITGMTRYACFWVQDGEIAGPLAADLRWDQSLYEALGPQQLLALSRETEIAPATSTYSQRALGGMRAPGALVEGFRYTL